MSLHNELYRGMPEGPGGVPCLPGGLAARGHERAKVDLLWVVNIAPASPEFSGLERTLLSMLPGCMKLRCAKGFPSSPVDVFGMFISRILFFTVV